MTPNSNAALKRIGVFGILFVLALLSIRIFWSLNTPLEVLYRAAHDDGLFLSRAVDLISGHWLGAYSQMTLMKGPGYPIFLALAAGSGLPVTLSHGLFQFLVISAAALAVARLTRSSGFGWATLVILVFLPACFDPSLQRVMRDQIYWGQVLLAFVAVAVVVFAPPEGRVARFALALVAGVLLAWAWLTREEGVWLIPGLAVLVIGALIRCWLEKIPVGPIFNILITVFFGFAVSNLAFITTNKVVYGSFDGVDFNERNFKAALAALQSIDDGNRLEYVPVNSAARQLAASASPTFAPLAESLKPGGALDGWTEHGCHIYPKTCGDLAGGWFVWALRDAAAINGFYASPQIASQKFGQIAAEIKAACDAGKLNCHRSILSDIPPMNAQQLLSIPGRVLKALQIISLADFQPILPSPLRPAFEAHSLDRPWMFLNYPKIVGPASSSVEVRSRVYAAGSTEWPQVRFIDEAGKVAESSVERRPSPNIVSQFKDVPTEMNRFVATVVCPDRCKLQVDFADGSSLMVPLKPGASAQSAAKTRAVWIDSIDGTHPASKYDPRVKAARIFTNAARYIYSLMFPAMLGLGFLSFLVAIVRDAMRRKADPVLVTALAAFVLVATRLVLLAVVDATLFPAVTMSYAIPAVYLAAVGSILSISTPLGKASAAQSAKAQSASSS